MVIRCVLFYTIDRPVHGMGGSKILTCNLLVFLIHESLFQRLWPYIVQIYTIYHPHAGIRARDTQLLCRGKRISAIGLMGMHGLLDVYTTTGTVDENVFVDFLERCVLPQMQPFNGSNPQCPSHGQCINPPY